MKNALKKIVISILVNQVNRLRQRHSFKVIAIAGSIGKTSTKFAVASVLGARYRVRFQTGNYNSEVTVPLVFFGASLPSLGNPVGWLRTFLRNERQIRAHEYPYDVVVIELGTDGPGQLSKDFSGYIHADVGILTAIAPEHMEFFRTIDEVAKEELVLGDLVDTLVINTDLCAPKFVPARQNLMSYGMESDSVYKIVNANLTMEGYDFEIHKHGMSWLATRHPSIAVPQLYSLTAGAVVADLLEMTTEEIRQGIASVQPVSGRMQLLKGIKQSTIIDESYNASPDAVRAALNTLYAVPGAQKIALLGNMNELGDEYSPEAHTGIGEYCDPTKLAWVITLGPDANEYLAPAAERQGCKVKRCESPYEAAEFIKDVLEDDSVVLIKGSQNRVFAEETIKMLLQDAADASKLVRQSAYWLGVKRKQFKDFSS